MRPILSAAALLALVALPLAPALAASGDQHDAPQIRVETASPNIDQLCDVLPGGAIGAAGRVCGRTLNRATGTVGADLMTITRGDNSVSALSDAIRYSQADADAVAQDLIVKARQRVDLIDFCPTSVLNSAGVVLSACVQKAVTNLCSRFQPGGTLNLPAANFRAVDVVVPCAVAIKGTQGTTWDYSGATAFGLQFKPPGWPALTHQQLIFNADVSDVNFFASDGSTGGRTIRALDFVGLNNGRTHHVTFTGNAYDAMRVYGAYKFDIDGWTSNYMANLGAGAAHSGIEIIGDMSGKSRAGGTCTLGDCSTRVDIVSFRNVDMLGTITGSGIRIVGTVNTTMGEHVSVENKAIGLETYCPPGFPDIRYCPQFLTFTDFQAEGAVTAPIYLKDATEAHFVSSYAVGNGATVGHDVEMTFGNYSQANGAGGGFQWIGGKAFNAYRSNFYLGVSDTKISDAVIYDGNLGNIGAAGVEYVGGVQHTQSNNTFCNYLGATSPPMAGVIVGSAASKVTILGNQYFGCTSGLTNNSAAPATVQSFATQGP